MSNTKITEELELKVYNYLLPPNIRRKTRNDLDDEDANKNPEWTSDKIEETKDDLVAYISEKETITKEYIKTQKVANTSYFISQLETLALTKKIGIQNTNWCFYFVWDGS